MGWVGGLAIGKILVGGGRNDPQFRAGGGGAGGRGGIRRHRLIGWGGGWEKKDIRDYSKSLISTTFPTANA